MLTYSTQAEGMHTCAYTRAPVKAVHACTAILHIGCTAYTHNTHVQGHQGLERKELRIPVCAFSREVEEDLPGAPQAGGEEGGRGVKGGLAAAQRKDAPVYPSAHPTLP